MSILLRIVSALALAGILFCMHSGAEVLFGVGFKILIAIFVVSLMMFRLFDDLEHGKYHLRDWMD